MLCRKRGPVGYRIGPLFCVPCHSEQTDNPSLHRVKQGGGQMEQKRVAMESPDVVSIQSTSILEWFVEEIVRWMRQEYGADVKVSPLDTTVTPRIEER